MISDLMNKITKNEFSKADLDAYLKTPGHSVNDQDDFMKRTLLFYAIKDVNLTRLLLDEYEANPNIEDKFGNTPLMIAASEGYFEVVQLLLAKEATVKSIAQDTALHRCIQSDHCTIEIVELLLQNTDKTTLDIEILGESALEMAMQEGKRPIVELLIEYGANVKKVLKKENNSQNGYPISLADLYTILEDKGRLVEDESEDKDFVAHNKKISEKTAIGLASTPLYHDLAKIVYQYYSLGPKTCSIFTTLFKKNSLQTTPSYMLSKTASDTQNPPSKKIRMNDLFESQPKYLK